jgi:phage tail sheath gpL-like
MASYNLTGIPADYPVPMTAVEIRFGTGPSGGTGGPYTALIIGNRTNAGNATVDTVVYGPSSNPPLQTEQDVIALCGAGSEAHRLYRRFVEVNKATQVSIICPAEAGGAAPGTITLTLATTAAAPDVLRIYVLNEFVDVPIATSAVPGDIAIAAAQRINNQAHWPVTANPSGSTIVITSKNLGPRANEIRVRALMLKAASMTVAGAATSTALSGGATSDDWTNVAATIAPSRFYYIVSPSNDIAGHTFDDLLTQVMEQALPANGRRQLIISGHVGTQNAAATIAANAAVNSVRARIVWQQESDWGTAGELAAQFAGARALFDTTRTPKFNFDGFGSTSATQQFWKVTPQSQQARRPTGGANGSIAAAVNNGLVCIATTTDGTGTYVVMDVTTKHRNGSNYDYRDRDGHITTVCDFFADECLGILDDMRVGKNLVSDPPAGVIVEDPDTVYPRLIAARLGALIQQYGDEGKFKNVPSILESLHVQVSAANQSRSEGYVRVQVVNLHHQAMLLIDEASSLTS